MIHHVIKNTIFLVSSELLFYGLSKYLKSSNYMLVNVVDIDDNYPIKELSYAKADLYVVSFFTLLYSILTYFLFSNLILENQIVIVVLSLILAFLSRYKCNPNKNLSTELMSKKYDNAFIRTLTLFVVLYNMIIPVIYVVYNLFYGEIV